MSKRPRPRLLDSLALTMTADDKKRANGTNSSTEDRTGRRISNQRSLTNHPIKHSTDTLRARDGEVVIYKRSQSQHYHCRYRLANGLWQRVSTYEASVESAIAVACALYDQARFRQSQGLAARAQSFAHLAAEFLKQLAVAREQPWTAKTAQPLEQRGVRAGRPRSQTALDAYRVCVRDHFLPYFKQQPVDEITQADLAAFEQWRDRRRPGTVMASTQQNYISAWNRLIAFACERGYLPHNHAAPRLKARGKKSTPRPAFTEDEVLRWRLWASGAINRSATRKQNHGPCAVTMWRCCC